MEATIERLLCLHRDSKEDDPNGDGINALSLLMFMEYLLLYPEFKEGIISLTPENEIYLKFGHTSIRFYQDGSTKHITRGL